MMTEAVEGHSKAEAEAMIEKFRDLMQGKGDDSAFEGDLKSLSGVKRFPVRIKCALLPWMTLKRALDGGCAGAKVDPANHHGPKEGS
jgi:nitrogen fixation NifU-like protein